VAQAAATSDGTATRYTLTVPADDSATPVRDGGAAGERLSFAVGDLVAAQTATWQPGVALVLNLTASHPEPAAEEPDPAPADHTPAPAAAARLWLPMARR